MEEYVLGYCIVNSPTVTWEISINGRSLETFMWGLNSVKEHKKGVIDTLVLHNTDESYLQNFPARILKGITSLDLRRSEIKSLAHAVSSMKNLKSLYLSPLKSKDAVKHVKLLSQQLLYNNIPLTNLSVTGVDAKFPPISSVLRDLLHGRVQNLYWSNPGVCDTKHLLELVSQSSLQTLTTSVSRCVENVELFTSLAMNTCLTNLTIVMFDIPPVSSLAIALQLNAVLQYLTLTVPNIKSVENCGKLNFVLDALKFNKILKELKINIACQNYPTCYKDFPEFQVDIDSRIVIGPYYEYYESFTTKTRRPACICVLYLFGCCCCCFVYVHVSG